MRPASRKSPRFGAWVEKCKQTHTKQADAPEAGTRRVRERRHVYWNSVNILPRAMLKKIALAIAVFLIILVALTFGENVVHQALAWFTHLTGIVFHNFSDLYWAVHDYVVRHSTKVIIALVLTLPISYWIIKNQQGEIGRRYSTRKIAIVLAIFLGWLGAHRFYLGQIGWGIVYLIILYAFAPLVVALSLIDAVRYLFMTDEDFALPVVRR